MIVTPATLSEKWLYIGDTEMATKPNKIDREIDGWWLIPTYADIYILIGVKGEEEDG